MTQAPKHSDPSAGPLTAGSLLEPLAAFHRLVPKWVEEEGLAMVGAWESIQFYQRSNQATTDFEDLYEEGHTEAFVKEAKAVGANCIITHYDYSFGFEEQKIQLAKAKAFIGLCHKHGMKAGVYFRLDSIGHEALVGTERDILSCVQRDELGPVGFAPYFHGLCYHHPKAVEWAKTWIRRAVEEFRADILHFDGFIFGGMEGMGVACRCPRCRSDFADFLSEKYGNKPEAARLRFGHTQVRNIEPPMSPDGMTRVQGVPRGPMTSPVWQEWIQFKCLWSTYLARLIARYVHSLDPNVAIEVNSCQGMRENDALNYGLDHPAYAGLFDAYWAEDGYGPGVLPTGEIISRMRHCKYVRNNGGTLLNYLHAETPRRQRQEIAHNFAFNGGSAGCLGFAPGMPYDFREFAEEKRAMLAWRKRHADLFRGVEMLSDVAVWRGQKAIAFGDGSVACASMRVEQVLIEDRIPFNLVSDTWLEQPGAERVLILPDVECIDDAQGDALQRYVETGGGLIVCQDSGRFDGWRRKRPDFLLRKLMGPEAGRDGGENRSAVTADMPAGFVSKANGGTVGATVTQHVYGRGRVVYIPEILRPGEQRSTVDERFRYDFGLDYAGWKLPACADELRAAIRWCLNGPLRVHVQAERGVLTEYAWQEKTGRTIVHLVNLLTQPACPVKVTLALAPEKTLQDVRVETPDPGGGCATRQAVSDRQVTIELDQLDVYAAVVIAMG
ncbi:MAG: hypothetical protein PHR35_14760 [Kiritimatiellae bacterium]|nr:hypothetical protein [Kiritimatiellia bacterium]